MAIFVSPPNCMYSAHSTVPQRLTDVQHIVSRYESEGQSFESSWAYKGHRGGYAFCVALFYWRDSVPRSLGVYFR